MKHHGIGVGYRYPHDFEGADVEQRTCRTSSTGKRYWYPTDHGQEAGLAARHQERLDERSGPASNRARRPAVDGMRASSEGRSTT